MTGSGGFTRRQGFTESEEIEAANSRFASGPAGSFEGRGETRARRGAVPARAAGAKRAAAKGADAALLALTGEADEGEGHDVDSGAYRAARTALKAREGRRGSSAAADAEGDSAGAVFDAETPPTAQRGPGSAAQWKGRAAAGPGDGPGSANGGKRLSAKAREGLGGRASRRGAAKGPPSAGAQPLADAQAASNYAKSRAALGNAAEAAGAARAKAGGGIAAAASTAAPAAAGIMAGIAAFVAACLLLSSLAGAITGFWEDERAKASVEGLPPYITYDMVLAALECQDEYGHPAGCTLAQIICESGQGERMSMLATRDNNLFGIKWSPSFAVCPEVRGKASWSTHEEYSGQAVTVMADFTVFESAEDCIRFRSRVLLQNARYAGNALIKRAIAEHDSDKMAEGLKDAGYATDSSYVATLKSIMETYDLYRFDGLSAEGFEGGGASGNAIVRAAFSQLGVPYVWGGETPGKGLDCSGLTQYCYRQAGIRISHYSESQKDELTAIPLSKARPGDILYRPGHVAIYIGGDEYIHEPHTGDVCRKATGIAQFTCALRYTG